MYATGRSRRAERHTSSALSQKMAEGIPLERVGTATEIADVVVFLPSPALRYITGEMIDVDRGLWTNY